MSDARESDSDLESRIRYIQLLLRVADDARGVIDLLQASSEDATADEIAGELDIYLQENDARVKAVLWEGIQLFTPARKKRLTDELESLREQLHSSR